MEKYIYAIPSYNRVDKQVTLDYLSGMGVPKEKIWIFTQTEEDYEKYQKHKDRATIRMAPATRGVAARNNILNGLKGNNILMMDDDVKAILSLNGGKLTAFAERIDLAFAFNRCFEQTRGLRARVFGVYPVANAFFMSNDISTKVAINTIFGFTSDFTVRFDERFETKEDAEICGRMLKHGSRVVRFNNLAVNADHRKDKNGYFDQWHHDENVRSVRQLCARFPDIFAPKKDQPWEVRMKLRDEKVKSKEFRNTAAQKEVK